MRVRIERAGLPRTRWRNVCPWCAEQHTLNHGEIGAETWAAQPWRRTSRRARRDARKHFLRLHAGDIRGESIDMRRQRKRDRERSA